MMSKLYLVRNVDGSRKLFKNIPILMTQEKISKCSDRDHPHNNVPTYINPIWVDYNATKNTMSFGNKISRDVVSAIGIDYDNMDCKKVYKIEVNYGENE